MATANPKRKPRLSKFEFYKKLLILKKLKKFSLDSDGVVL
jgi:hypothetical protein